MPSPTEDFAKVCFGFPSFSPSLQLLRRFILMSKGMFFTWLLLHTLILSWRGTATHHVRRVRRVHRVQRVHRVHRSQRTPAICYQLVCAAKCQLKAARKLISTEPRALGRARLQLRSLSSPVEWRYQAEVNPRHVDRTYRTGPTSLIIVVIPFSLPQNLISTQRFPHHMCRPVFISLIGPFKMSKFRSWVRHSPVLAAKC